MGRRPRSGCSTSSPPALDNGVDRLAIADTIGTTTPRRVSDLIAQIRPLIGDIPLGAHFHNTRGAGLASAYAAVSRASPGWTPRSAGSAAARSRPGASGNIATEDLVYLLRDSGIQVDVDLQAAIAAAASRRTRSDTTCRARCCAPATGSGGDRDAPRIDGRAREHNVSPTLSAKGRQTRHAIEQAARKLFAERGFHGTTLADITSAAGKSPAVFYRYFDDKEDLLAALAESFLHDIVAPSGLSLHLPDSPDDDAFFTSVVTGYWNMFKQNIGIMIAVAQLAATQPRFAAVQNEFRRFGMDIVAASVRRAQEQGYGAELDPEHTAAAIALLFENFTTVFVGTSGLGLEISDEDAITTLSTIWKKTLYGF